MGLKDGTIRWMRSLTETGRKAPLISPIAQRSLLARYLDEATGLAGHEFTPDGTTCHGPCPIKTPPLRRSAIATSFISDRPIAITHHSVVGTGGTVEDDAVRSQIAPGLMPAARSAVATTGCSDRGSSKFAEMVQRHVPEAVSRKIPSPHGPMPPQQPSPVVGR